MGEVLDKTPKHAGGEPKGTRSHAATGSESPPKLSEIGLSKSESSRAQKAAKIPEEVFEEFLATAKTPTRSRQARVTRGI